MRISEAGLMSQWTKRNIPDVHQCLITKKKRSRIIEDSLTVSLRGMSGAFVVLLVGFALSVIVFIGERVRFWYLHQRLVGSFLLNSTNDIVITVPLAISHVDSAHECQ